MKKRFMLLGAILICAVAVSIGAVIALGNTADPEIKIKQYSLVLEDSVNIRYAVHFDKMPEADKVREKGILVFEKPQSEYTLASYDNAKNIIDEKSGLVAEKITDSLGKRDVGGVECEVYDYTGLAAKQFTDSIYVVGFVLDTDGNEYYSSLSKFSVLQYAKAMGYEPDGTDEGNEVLPLLRAMMEYGAAAQNFFEYGVGTLPTDKYYKLKTSGGAYIKSDLSKTGLYKEGAAVALFAPKRSGEARFAGWTKNGTEIAEKTNEITVTMGTEDAVYAPIYIEAVNIVLGGGTINGQSPEYLTYTEINAGLPTPEKAGCTFAGWYKEEALTASSVPVTTSEEAKACDVLYARWNVIDENYDKSSVSIKNISSSAISSGYTVTYNMNKNGSYAQALSDEDGGKYLKWYDAAKSSTAEGDSHIYINSTAALKSALKEEKLYTLTLKLKLEKDADGNALSATKFDGRIRADGGDIYLFTVAQDGTVILSQKTDAVIAKLNADTFTTISLTLDLDTLTLYSANNGSPLSIIANTTISDAYNPDTYIDGMGQALRLYADNNATGTILMDDLKISLGKYKHGESQASVDVSEIKNNINNFTFGTSFEQAAGEETYLISKPTLGAETTSFGSYGANTYSLADRSGDEPRLMLNSATIAKLAAAYNDPDNLEFRLLLDNMASSSEDGVLPAATYHSTKEERIGVHNYDGQVLYTLEAKALMYRIALYSAVSDEEIAAAELYGYQAVLGILNYLDTLNIQWINSDRCREYGSVMYVAAEIYDWCYGLMSDSTKEQIRLGVEYYLCKINGRVYGDKASSMTSYPNSMEVGFPPTGQGSVSGHGSEMQILRDYLAASIAFYGDGGNDWYNYVAGRVIEEYAAFRNAYYASGLYPQGSGTYAAHRFPADLFSAWMLECLGQNPYGSDMEQVMLSFAAYERPDGKMFVTGDGSATEVSAKACFMAGALFGNSTLYTIGYNGVESGTGANDLSVAQYFIFASNAPALTSDTYAERDVILYNGSYVGQIISRAEWSNENAPAAFMKIGVRSTANHEHADAGTFQIYYKGMLTGDSGVYASYGSDHHKYYHQATVAHNGLLIYNPAAASENGGTSYYCGGQKASKEVAKTTVTQWLDAANDSNYKTGEMLGAAYGYKDEAKTKADYAYISGDISAAYPSGTASYVGRSMLTIYTDDANVPMIFVTFDRIVTAESFKSTYLLHVNTANAPTIDGNTVTIDNGKGKLVFKSLTDAEINGVGGGTGKNYLINGVQCDKVGSGTAGNDHNWGRVELSATGTTTNFFGVMYVTDSGKTPDIEIGKLTGTNIEAAQAGKHVFGFVNSDNKRAYSSKLTSTAVAGEDTLEYYLGGFAAGQWMVTVDGVEYKKITITDEEGLLHFEAPAGEITVLPWGN